RRRRHDRRAALTAASRPLPSAGQPSGFFIDVAWNRSRTAFHPNGERCNKLLLYGDKSGT
ncbi:TPA: hypothetical protein ACT5B9_006109, partial [Burkholderia cenocepacia]